MAIINHNPARGALLFTATIHDNPVGADRKAQKGKHQRFAQIVYTTNSRTWMQAAAASFRSIWIGRAPYEGPVVVEIEAVKARPKRLLRKKDPDCRIFRAAMPDADNVSKATLDSLTNAGVLRDDRFVVDDHIRSWWAARDEGPSVQVNIYALADGLPWSA